MPPLPSEDHVLTVFADIHYYFTAPTPKPLYHRLDKGSYFYLYHNTSTQKLRLEVANNPGTSDQDAFNGALDHVYLRHSTAFPTLCTLTVDGRSQQTSQDFPLPPSTNPYEWQLPTNDAQCGTTDLQRLHTLDIYFWTLDDANQFLDLAERYLSQSQIETNRHPFPAPSEATVSSVVQQLENVAITDPAYQNGQTRNSREGSTPASYTSAAPAALPHPPPVSAQQTPTGTRPAPEQPHETAQFTPLPYNPAAPAAPEPIQHRVKTPPPAGAADGTGLAAAAAADSGAPIAPPSQFSGGSYAPPPSQGLSYSLPGSYASPPPSADRSGSFSSRSSIQSPPGVPSYSPAFLAGSVQPVTQVGAMSFAPPPVDPNAHLYGQSLYGSQPQVQAQPTSPTPPIGGYSNYSYEPAPTRAAPNNDYGMHKQLYRPTEEEAKSHAQKYAQKALQNPQNPQRSRKFEDGTSRVESSVNRFLKKLEKRF